MLARSTTYGRNGGARLLARGLRKYRKSKVQEVGESRRFFRCVRASRPAYRPGERVKLNRQDRCPYHNLRYGVLLGYLEVFLGTVGLG